MKDFTFTNHVDKLKEMIGGNMTGALSLNINRKQSSLNKEL